MKFSEKLAQIVAQSETHHPGLQAKSVNTKRSRKPLNVVRRSVGSNPTPSVRASQSITTSRWVRREVVVRR
jgi:hypothetical protein